MTFCKQQSLNQETVRRDSVISGLLLLVVATSASGCVTGWNSTNNVSCTRPASHRICSRDLQRVRATGGRNCGSLLRSGANGCSLRSLAQLQFLEFRRSAVATPLPDAVERIEVCPHAVIVLSSIGSPETDRGPPRS